MIDVEQLLPCPFCGKEPTVVVDEQNKKMFWISCPDEKTHMATTRAWLKEELCVEAWNKRYERTNRLA